MIGRGSNRPPILEGGEWFRAEPQPPPPGQEPASEPEPAPEPEPVTVRDLLEEVEILRAELAAKEHIAGQLRGDIGRLEARVAELLDRLDAGRSEAEKALEAFARGMLPYLRRVDQEDRAAEEVPA